MANRTHVAVYLCLELGFGAPLSWRYCTVLVCPWRGLCPRPNDLFSKHCIANHKCLLKRAPFNGTGPKSPVRMQCLDTHSSCRQALVQKASNRRSQSRRAQGFFSILFFYPFFIFCSGRFASVPGKSSQRKYLKFLAEYWPNGRKIKMENCSWCPSTAPRFHHPCPVVPFALS